MQGKVEFKNVGFKYDEKNKKILENINFIVQPGEMIALVGASDEGKTTLVDLISLYFKPPQGEILIDDINIKDFNLRFLREKIAYVFQEIILFNDTIENNIRIGKPKASNKGVIEAAKAANTHQFIENFPNKYNQIVGERRIKLSTGQK
jgi:ABC-type multidrug transport system fused ATPase/permease subunit